MPKNTFFNLPEEKRERIIEAAIDEFAKNLYHNASITRIVDNSGIAKGSFYQYFEDKKDLFKYILDLGGKKKTRYLEHVLTEIDNMNFFSLIRELFIAGIIFSKENPKLSNIGCNFANSADEKLKKEIYGENVPKSNHMFKILLQKSIAREEINPDIDVDLVSQMITNLSIFIIEYFFKEIRKTDNMEMLDLVDKMLFVLKNGIKRN